MKIYGNTMNIIGTCNYSCHNKGISVLNISFGEVFCGIYSQKFSFKNRRERSRKISFPSVYLTIHLPK